jgi:signal transduction histidine kinase
MLILLAWASAAMIGAETKARFESNLRLALWRMDNRFAAVLAREADRPHTEYAPFHYLQQSAYTRKLFKIQPEQIFTESPLMQFESELIPLHFQVDGTGQWTSPQVPYGNFLEQTVPALLSQERYETNVGVLDQLERQVDPGPMEPPRQTLQQVESRRAQAAQQAKGGSETGGTRVGAFEAEWQNGELIFLRTVEERGETYRQGFLLDWPRLKSVLLEETADLFEEADLRPTTEGDTDRALFTIPATLEVSIAGAAIPGWTPAHTTLLLLWSLAIVSVAMGAWALRRSLRFANQQRRFASLVTHELRSPLTTFRLYSDLLAEGLVSDDERKSEYHRTLQRESDQMARIVENVIAHTRVEEGRAQLHPESLTLADLVARLEKNLRKPAEECGLGIEFEIRDGEATLTTDAEAVGQILLNLVENACKYGRSDRDPGVAIAASAAGDWVELSVRDHGTGIAPAAAARLFRPFERGEDHGDEPIRGLGLGLALSRGLARDLGGSLELEHPADGGARFVLRLPRD